MKKSASTISVSLKTLQKNNIIYLKKPYFLILSILILQIVFLQISIYFVNSHIPIAAAVEAFSESTLFVDRILKDM